MHTANLTDITGFIQALALFLFAVAAVIIAPATSQLLTAIARQRGGLKLASLLRTVAAQIDTNGARASNHAMPQEDPMLISPPPMPSRRRPKKKRH